MKPNRRTPPQTCSPRYAQGPQLSSRLEPYLRLWRTVDAFYNGLAGWWALG
jgi:hypothetical protein